MVTRYTFLTALALLLVGCAAQPAQQAYSLHQRVHVEPWAFGQTRGEVLSTAHFQLHTTCSDQRFTRIMCGFLEAARTNYADLTSLKEAPPESASQRPWPVYLLATRSEWAALTQKVTGPQAPIYLRIESGGYCHQGVSVFWSLQPLGTYSVAAHEGLHQFLHHMSRQSLPIWAEEGLATQAEGFRLRADSVSFEPANNPLRYQNLRRAIYANRWRPAAKLIVMDAADNAEGPVGQAPEYYGQLWAMLQLIRQDPQYSAGLQAMVADTAAGRLDQALGIEPDAWASLVHDARLYNQVVGPRAFAHYIDPDIAHFEQRFRAFANELVGFKEAGE